MTTNLIDLRNAPRKSDDDFGGLQAILTQLVGEPYRFARVSYGDELTLHFGDLRLARSPKLPKHTYGAFILGLRGSPWILKAGAEPFVATAGTASERPGAAFAVRAHHRRRRLEKLRLFRLYPRKRLAHGEKVPRHWQRNSASAQWNRLAYRAGIAIELAPLAEYCQPAKFGKHVSHEELESTRLIEPESRVLAATPFIVKPANGLALQLRLSDGASLLILPSDHEPDEPEDEALPELADWELIMPCGLLSAGPGLTWTFEPTRASP